MISTRPQFLVQLIQALLASRGSKDINKGDPHGWTPLMCAARERHSGATRVLLDNGAKLSIEGRGGVTALLLSSEQGHSAVTKILTDAGADPAAALSRDRSTPLHLAATGGHSEVMRAPIEAGACSNSRRLDGATPLYLAAGSGHLDATKILLHAEADPMLTAGVHTPWKIFVPLDEEAGNGHTEVVRELLQRSGLKGCGDAGGRIVSLATRHTHVDAMALLMEAGLVDTGEALIVAASFGRLVSAKFLLERQRCNARGEEKGEESYANAFDKFTTGPLLNALGLRGYPAPRIVRMLVAGANASNPSTRRQGGPGDIGSHTSEYH